MSSRTLKVEPDTYQQNGTSGSLSSSSDYAFSLNRTPFEVKTGETKQTTWTVIEYSTFITTDLSDMVANEVFTSKAKSIALYCGDTVLGSWGKPEYFNRWSDSQRRGISPENYGENLPVRVEIVLAEGVTEEDVPYEIVPDVTTLTVEEGGNYTIKFTTVEKQ